MAAMCPPRSVWRSIISPSATHLCRFSAPGIPPGSTIHFELAPVRNFQAGIGVLFPFTNNYKVGKERISEVAPFRSETFVKETGQMFILRIGYTFEFGRKHKAGNKGLNNSDTDSGIIDMQR